MTVVDEAKAIKILSQRDDFGIPCGMTSGYPEAIETAIQALKDVKKYKQEAARYRKVAEKYKRAIEEIRAEMKRRQTHDCVGAYGLELALTIVKRYLKR